MPDNSLSLQSQIEALERSHDLEELKKVLGITNPDELAGVLLFLYATDPEVNRVANKKLVAAYLRRFDGRKHLPMIPPKFDEFSWWGADRRCGPCPGSDLREFGPSFFMPQCLSSNRGDKYADCGKYRENLAHYQSELDSNRVDVKELQAQIMGV